MINNYDKIAMTGKLEYDNQDDKYTVDGDSINSQLWEFKNQNVKITIEQIDNPEKGEE